MASTFSSIALTVVFGFYAVLCCLQLQLLGGGADTMTTTIQAESGGLAVAARLAAAALVPAVVATLTVTPLLSFAYVGELVRANAVGNGGGGGAVSRLVTWLARATLLAATAALIAGAVVQLGADGHLDRGRGDVARLNIK